MIRIYKLISGDGRPIFTEYAKFEDGEITGKINIKDITKEEVLNEFNRGYYRTSEV